MAKLHFGTAGVPQSSKKRDTLSGIQEISDLGLDLMELEFVHGVRMKEEKASIVNDLRSKLGIELTVHGPYYVNLASKKPEIRASSKHHILSSARIGAIAGANSVTFHPSYFQDLDKTDVYNSVRDSLSEIVETLSNENVEIIIAPETTGKPTQFGQITDLVKLCDELGKKIKLCLDFAHVHARDNGGKNRYEHFKASLELIKSELGQEFLDNMHMHISGINYGEKGEKNHLMLTESDIYFEELIQALIDMNVGGYLVCESPIQNEDALLLKSTFEKLSR